MDQPFLQIVRGDPTAEELTALIAVIRARAQAAAGDAGRPARRGPVWAERSRLVRRPIAPGPGAWRASAFPR